MVSKTLAYKTMPEHFAKINKWLGIITRAQAFWGMFPAPEKAGWCPLGGVLGLRFPEG